MTPKSSPLKTEAIAGFFISFTPEEKAEIKDGLQRLEYSQSDDGLKKFILDAFRYEEIDESEEGAADRVIRRVGNFIDENPDTVDRVAQTAGALFKMIKKKVTKK